MKRTVTVEHNGNLYDAEPMVIKSTFLGQEDHGIFTAMLHCEGDGVGISVGGYGLDAWSEEDNRRIGTSYGLEHIKAILRVAGVDTWEKLPGTHILVLYGGGQGGWGGRSVGFAHPVKRLAVVFSEQAEEWRARGVDS